MMTPSAALILSAISEASSGTFWSAGLLNTGKSLIGWSILLNLSQQ